MFTSAFDVSAIAVLPTFLGSTKLQDRLKVDLFSFCSLKEFAPNGFA